MNKFQNPSNYRFRSAASLAAALGITASTLMLPVSAAHAETNKVITGTTNVDSHAVNRISACTSFSLTVTKHARNPYSDPPAGKKWAPLEGQQFIARRVAGIDLLTNAGWRQAQKLTLDEVVDGAFEQTYTATTNASGAAAFGTVKPGLYVVEQTSVPGYGYVKDVVLPFVVTVPTGNVDRTAWNCDVDIQAKAKGLDDHGDEGDDDDDGDGGSSTTPIVPIPTPGDPDRPTISTSSTTTPASDGGSGGSGSGSGSGEKSSSSSGGTGTSRLPMTGANVVALMILGAGLVSAGFILMAARRRRQQ